MHRRPRIPRGARARELEAIRDAVGAEEYAPIDRLKLSDGMARASAALEQPSS